MIRSKRIRTRYHHVPVAGVLALVALIGAPVVALADELASSENACQDQEDRRTEAAEQARKGMEKIKEELGITDEQEKKLRPLFEQHSTDLRALLKKVEKGGLWAKLKVRKKLKDLQRIHDARLADTLSQEQMAKLRDIRKEQKDKLLAQMRERRKTGNARKPSGK